MRTPWVVAVGDEWVFSGPTSVLRPAERDVAYQLALKMSLHLPEAVFADPALVRCRRYREQVLAYLYDDSVEPLVLRRLAERDPERASVVFRWLLKRPRFDWTRDGEELLRACKSEHFIRMLTGHPRLLYLHAYISSQGEKWWGSI